MMPSNQKNNKDIEVPWNIFDIAVIYLTTYALVTMLTIIILFATESSDVSFKYFRYISALLFIFTPYLWLKKQYQIKWEVLGLKKGNYSILTQIAIGFICAFFIILIIRIIPFWYINVLKCNTITIKNYISVIIVPFTFFGFFSFVLAPFGEEILQRGIAYKYFKKKTGIISGLIIQSIFSTILHFSHFSESFPVDFLSWFSYMFFVQIILGLIYEKTDSIYPSTVCHAVFNYSIFLYFYK